MLDEREISAAIAELEYKNSSFQNYQKLANLYIIRNQMKKEEGQGGKMKREAVYENAYSGAPDPEQAGLYGDSSFLKAVAGKDMASAWAVIDDLMDTLQAVNPRVYESVMRKIQSL